MKQHKPHNKLRLNRIRRMNRFLKGLAQRLTFLSSDSPSSGSLAQCIDGRLSFCDFGTSLYDRQGVPLSLGQWAELCENQDYCRIAHDQLGPVMISTIWLGIDHNFFRMMPDSPQEPLIFETMIFVHPDADPELQEHNQEMARYATEEEARAGHKEAVQFFTQEILVPVEARDTVQQLIDSATATP